MNFNPGMAREWQDDGCPHGYQKVINLQELVDVWQTPKRYVKDRMTPLLQEVKFSFVQTPYQEWLLKK